MIITFNELRRIKDKLPSGSSQRIADELGIDVETVRNYFGGQIRRGKLAQLHELDRRVRADVSERGYPRKNGSRDRTRGRD